MSRSRSAAARASCNFRLWGTMSGSLLRAERRLSRISSTGRRSRPTHYVPIGLRRSTSCQNNRSLSVPDPTNGLQNRFRIGRDAPLRTHATAAKCPRHGLHLLCFCPHEPEALQALGWPGFGDIVELGNYLCAGRKRHPRLLGGGENVNV